MQILPGCRLEEKGEEDVRRPLLPLLRLRVSVFLIACSITVTWKEGWLRWASRKSRSQALLLLYIIVP